MITEHRLKRARYQMFMFDLELPLEALLDFDRDEWFSLIISWDVTQ